MFAHHFANTSQLYHNSNRGLYSENLASDSGSGGPSTTDHILSREFVCCVVPIADPEVYCCLALKYFEIPTTFCVYSSFTQDGSRVKPMTHTSPIDILPRYRGDPPPGQATPMPSMETLIFKFADILIQVTATWTTTPPGSNLCSFSQVYAVLNAIPTSVIRAMLRRLPWFHKLPRWQQ